MVAMMMMMMNEYIFFCDLNSRFLGVPVGFQVAISVMLGQAIVRGKDKTIA
jgi:hypothetical protein